MTGKRRLSVFWKSYIILCAVLAVIIAAGTLFFYDYIKAFETGRPEYAVKEYVAAISESDIISAVSDALEGKLSGYEADGAVASEVKAAFEEYELSYVRDFESQGDGLLSYDVYCGEKLLTLTLSVTSGGKYGYDNYLVTGVSVADEWLDARRTSVSAVIPTKSVLTVNGKQVMPELAVETFTSDAVSEFESDEFTLTMYEIADIFGSVEAEATLDGAVLALGSPSAGVYTALYESVDTVFTVTAPVGAEVCLNGIPLADSYITSTVLPEDALKFEADASVRSTVYTVTGLRLAPVVTATLDGTELTAATLGADSATFAYPDSYKHAYTAVIPEGATLYCNGVEVGKEYYVGASEQYQVPDSAKKYAKQTDSGEVYTVTGLYAEPVFTVVYDDGTSAVGEKAEDAWIFYPRAGEREASLRDMAQLFTELYVKYTYEGSHTEENYEVVMQYVKSGSAAYKTMRASKDPMWYNSNFTVDKLETEIYNPIKYADKCYEITVFFDSHGTYYRYEKVSVGTYVLTWILDGGQWLLVDFVFQ